MDKAERTRRKVRMSKPYFPLFIDLSQKKIVVIGGGNIAERRVKTLLKFTEDIQIVSPRLTEELYRLAEDGQINWHSGSYTAGTLEGADIVLAVTNDAVCNEQIARECKSRGILVNTAHKKELCDFYFPAVVVEEHVVAGITASGQSHVQAGKARRQVEKAFKNLKNDEEQYGKKSHSWQQKKQTGSNPDRKCHKIYKRKSSGH